QKKVTKETSAAKAPVATVDTTSSPLKNNQNTLKATQALLDHIKQQRSQASTQPGAKKNLLAGDDEQDVLGAEKEAIYVVFTTKKFLTDRKNLKPKRIAIPHPIYNAKDTSICLFSKDPQRAYKDALLTGQGENKDEPAHASLTRVIGVSKLKGKFKSFEARRALMGQHDIFIAEDNVVTTLPRLLGKTFYESGKIPLSVNLESRDAISAVKAKSEIIKILNSTLFTVAPGTYSAIKIGYTTDAFSAKDLVANLEAVAEYFSEKVVSNGWNGIRGVHIKTASSTSLPIWATESL
ncbi:ribosomal protein L1, partial [Nadsonia fulvescens var. elongata DSM 6958]